MSELHKKISRLRKRIASAQLRQSKNKKLDANLYSESRLSEAAQTIYTCKKQLIVLEEELKKSKKK